LSHERTWRNANLSTLGIANHIEFAHWNGYLNGCFGPAIAGSFRAFACADRRSVVTRESVSSSGSVHINIGRLWYMLEEASPQFREMIENAEDAQRELVREVTIETICEILSTEIKRDFTTTAITFLAALLNYTGRQSVLVTYKAGTSTGKSYITLRVLDLFPKEDIIKLAGASPTSFFHELGTPVYEDVIDENGKPAKRLLHILVDLCQKIVVFLDQPDPRLLERLRSFCSKDTDESVFKITDRTTSGSQRTKTIVLKGPATFFYCTARYTAESQENSRTFILSPSGSEDQEKLCQAIDLIATKETDYDFFSETLANDSQRRWLRERILLIKKAKIREINLTPEDSEYLKSEFLKRHPVMIPRNSRDFPRVIALAKGCALLNLWHRRTEHEHVIQANRSDIDAALKLYDEVSEANESGLAPALLEWFHAVIMPFWKEDEYPDRRQIARKHLEVYHEPLPRTRFERDYVPALEAASLIFPQTNPEDKRRTVYAPVKEEPKQLELKPRDDTKET
jgi:hypothetical protein